MSTISEFFLPAKKSRTAPPTIRTSSPFSSKWVNNILIFGEKGKGILMPEDVDLVILK